MFYRDKGQGFGSQVQPHLDVAALSIAFYLPSDHRVAFCAPVNWFRLTDKKSAQVR